MSRFVTEGREEGRGALFPKAWPGPKAAHWMGAVAWREIFIDIDGGSQRGFSDHSFGWRSPVGRENVDIGSLCRVQGNLMNRPDAAAPSRLAPCIAARSPDLVGHLRRPGLARNETLRH